LFSQAIGGAKDGITSPIYLAVVDTDVLSADEDEVEDEDEEMHAASISLPLYETELTP
jgi:hypothetical protein